MKTLKKTAVLVAIIIVALLIVVPFLYSIQSMEAANATPWGSWLELIPMDKGTAFQFSLALCAILGAAALHWLAYGLPERIRYRARD